MIDKQYENIQSPSSDCFNFHPEMSTVQLLLPCFVASFLDLHSEKGVSQVTKRQYQQIIHDLIRSYEETPFVRKHRACRVHPSSIWYMNSRTMNDRVKRCVDEVIVHLENIFGPQSRMVLHIHKFCLQYLRTCSVQRQSDDIRTDHWLQIECIWFSYIYKFLVRFLEVLKKRNIIPLNILHHHRGVLHFSEERCIWDIFACDKGWMQKHISLIYLFKSGTHGLLQNIPIHIRIAAERLRLEQMASLVIYLDIKDFRRKTPKWVECPIFPLDGFAKVYQALKANDLWKLKILMTFNRDQVEDFSLVSYQFAKNNFLYKDVMRNITPRGKVIMKSQGEITLCPIKHCRWCGQANLKQFRVCPACKDDPLYPDMNFFCSVACEKQCLKNQHIEEHAQYLMRLIGLVEW
jgi:hypothetical protein